MIIDIHPHIISDDTVKYPITPLGNKRSKWSEERGSLTAEKLIDAMKSAGVDKAVVVHSTTTYGYNCDYVADSAAKYPEWAAWTSWPRTQLRDSTTGLKSGA